MKDPYQTLGVDKTAQADVIKKAYRNLAKEYHPYKSKGNKVKFTEIADAYKL
jgi:molecular chaperone DnaJ